MGREVLGARVGDRPARDLRQPLTLGQRVQPRLDRHAPRQPGALDLDEDTVAAIESHQKVEPRLCAGLVAGHNESVEPADAPTGQAEQPPRVPLEPPHRAERKEPRLFEAALGDQRAQRLPARLVAGDEQDLSALGQFEGRSEERLDPVRLRLVSELERPGEREPVGQACGGEPGVGRPARRLAGEEHAPAERATRHHVQRDIGGGLPTFWSDRSGLGDQPTGERDFLVAGLARAQRDLLGVVLWSGFRRAGDPGGQLAASLALDAATVAPLHDLDWRLARPPRAGLAPVGQHLNAIPSHASTP